MESPKKSNVVELGAHSYMSVDELASFIKRNAHDYDVLIVGGYDKDDNFVNYSTETSRKDALWICEHLKKSILGDL